MGNKKDEMMPEENVISFNFSDDNQAEEVSFLSGPIKTYDIGESKTESAVSSDDGKEKTETEVKVKNKREPLTVGNVRKPVEAVKTEKTEEIPVNQEKTDVTHKKTEEPAAKKEEEAVVFNADEPKAKEPAAEKAEVASKPEEEEIVFAFAQAPVKKTKIVQQKTPKKKSRFPVIPLTVSAAVICLAAGGAFFLLNGNNAAPEVVSGNESVVSQEAKDAAASDQEDSIQTLPLIREESADIKTINTASIVFGDNVTVSGVKVAGKTLSEAYDALQNRILDLRDDIKIEISCSNKNITLTQNDFEFDTDLSNVLIQAYHYSRGELDEPTVEYADNGNVRDFSVMSVINKNSISAAVKKVAEKFDIQPQDAHVKSFNPDKSEKFTYADGSDGYLISQKVVQEEITSILEQPDKKGGFNVKAVRTPYKKTLEAVKANTKLIGSHCTTANNVWASVFNMELAIKSCNGYVVKPGETFSFNKMTGDTTTGELGYVPSTAIVGGNYEQQYGGGICQAATTIYIAAMKAGMEAVERHAHQYASVYADRGIDATVDYGNLDMKFKNNYDYPIYIATYVYDYNGDGCDELCVEFYGPISSEFDEIVPVGWINSIGNNDYSAAGAQVYFKDGKEVKRVYLPEGSYDYHGEGYYTLESMMPSDPEYGPKDVQPTGSTPTVYSPNGCGSSAPVPYGTASDYLNHASITQSSSDSSKTEDDSAEN